MNNTHTINKILDDYVLEGNCSTSFEVKNIFTQIEQQTNNSIVIINITEKYPADFFKKQEQKNVLYLTTKKVGFDNELVIKKESLLEVKKILCDLLFTKNSKTKLVGITGTNGKTSTAFYLNQMFAMSNLTTRYVGTIGVYEGLNKISKFHQTSPDYVDIRKDLSKNYQYLIYEVSSHGLDQNRFYDLSFSAAAWTSFSQDHLDYHKTMENYFKAKLKILDHLEADAKCFIYQKQTELYNLLKDYSKVEAVLTTEDFLNYFAEVNITLALNIFNNLEVGKKINISNLVSPPGRFEQVKFKTNTIIIDYAHTPDALEHLLIEVKKSFKDQIILIFGCGGNRDPIKRPLMGKIAEQYADQVIITEDNNRNELFTRIANDIKKGMTTNPIEIPKRYDAISKACLENKNKIIVIAGKGHEDTMETNAGIISFNDLEIVRELENGNI